MGVVVEIVVTSLCLWFFVYVCKREREYMCAYMCVCMVCV